LKTACLKGRGFRPYLQTIILLLLLAFVVSGCGQVSGESNFTLAGGEHVPGPLLLLSNNAILEKDSRVDGPVVMLCCNLIVNGEIGGDILLVSGNIRIDDHASVDGDVHVISGNVAR
jgi:cytoskeletal protein CcmA (bactofilin family)